MRVDILHLMAKGELAKVVARCMAYVATMKQQGKPLERVIVSESVYAQLVRKSAGHAPGRRVVLCCGDALVHFNHEPIDESEPTYEAKPRYVAELPPVAANPFGVAAPVKPTPHLGVRPSDSGDWDGTFDDDDVPF